MTRVDLIRAFADAAEDMAQDWLASFRAEGVREGLRLSAEDAAAIEDAFARWVVQTEDWREEHGL